MQAGRDDLARYPEISKLFPLGLPPSWVRDFDKPAGQRCPHQRHTGCSVYGRRPFGCRIWSCAWLSNCDTAGMRRPDRAGYVIDMMPDFIRYVHKDGSGPEGGVPIEVVQIWIDPRRRDDWRQDAELRAFIERRAAEGKAAILRFSSREGLILIAPALSEDKQWHEIGDAELAPERSLWPDDVRIAMEIAP
jgi:hypothetical protein